MRRRWVSLVLVCLLLLGVATAAVARGQTEAPDAECECGTLYEPDTRKSGQREESLIDVRSTYDNLVVRYFDPVLDIEFGRAIGENDLAFVRSQEELAERIEPAKFVGLANIDLFLVVDEEAGDDSRKIVQIERPVHSIDPDKVKATIRLTEAFFRDRGVAVTPQQIANGTRVLYFEMVAGSLMSHSFAVDHGYLGELRTGLDRGTGLRYVEFDVYVWRTDDLMVYISG